MNWCKFLWGNPCRAIETFYHWDSCFWDFGFSTHFSHSVTWKSSEKDSAVSFLHANNLHLSRNPCKAIETFYHWSSCLWDFGFSMIFGHSAAWMISETNLMESFFHDYWHRDGKLQVSPLEHCPLVSHCQQSPRILCTRCFVPWFLTTAFFSKFPFLAPKFLFRISCSILLFTIAFNLW